jgi:hypothetical protein
VTKPGECRGDKPTRELIACLQPDRRVEVEVSVANEMASYRPRAAQPPAR